MWCGVYIPPPCRDRIFFRAHVIRLARTTLSRRTKPLKEYTTPGAPGVKGNMNPNSRHVMESYQGGRTLSFSGDGDFGTVEAVQRKGRRG